MLWYLYFLPSALEYSQLTLSLRLHQPFTEFFPRADIYELMSPDILHQAIKGAFKDHLVTWIGKYLVNEYGGAEARKIMDDIDRR